MVCVVKMQCPNCSYTWNHYVHDNAQLRKVRCPRCGWLYAKPHQHTYEEKSTNEVRP